MTDSITQAAPTGADDFGVRPTQRVRKQLFPAAAWAATVFLMYRFIVAADYPLHDGDSVLYQSIASSLASRPWAEWLVPMWPPGWSKTGRFVEHLPFFFWPTAALGSNQRTGDAKQQVEAAEEVDQVRQKRAVR